MLVFSELIICVLMMFKVNEMRNYDLVIFCLILEVCVFGIVDLGIGGWVVFFGIIKGGWFVGC